MKRLKMSDDRPPQASNRLLTKLQQAVAEKKFYEAHQLLKTLNFRYSNTGKHDELEQLLTQNAAILFQNSQIESGIDVSIMWAKLVKAQESQITEDRVSIAVNLFNMMPQCPDRATYLVTILEWCSKHTLAGEIYAAAAKKYTAEHCYNEAWKHLTRITDGSKVKDLAQPIFRDLRLRPEEIEITSAILVISYLSIGRIALAEQAYTQLVQGQQLTPLLNSVRFLVESAKRKDSKAFETIKELYEPSLHRDMHLRKLVGAAGKKLFGLKDKYDKPNDSFLPAFMNALFSDQ